MLWSKLHASTFGCHSEVIIYPHTQKTVSLSNTSVMYGSRAICYGPNCMLHFQVSLVSSPTCLIHDYVMIVRWLDDDDPKMSLSWPYDDCNVVMWLSWDDCKMIAQRSKVIFWISSPTCLIHDHLMIVRWSDDDDPKMSLSWP